VIRSFFISIWFDEGDCSAVRNRTQYKLFEKFDPSCVRFTRDQITGGWDQQILPLTKSLYFKITFESWAVSCTVGGMNKWLQSNSYD